jgi:cytochrome oxidase Cu insertion factor (SCO1/SenC/PrrC family)
MRWIPAVLLLLAVFIPVNGQDKKDPEKKNKFDRRREVAIKEGDAAPDFTLKDAEGKNAVKLSELKGKPTVLIFGSCT